MVQVGDIYYRILHDGLVKKNKQPLKRNTDLVPMPSKKNKSEE